MGPVEFDDSSHVQVGDAISVGHEKSRLVAKPTPEPLKSPPGGCGLACVDNSNAPRWHVVSRHQLDRTCRQVEDGIALAQAESRKILAYRLALVSSGNHEVLDAGLCVDLTDMPKDWMLADLHHRLGQEISLFCEPAPKTSGKDDRLHGRPDAFSTEVSWGPRRLGSMSTCPLLSGWLTWAYSKS